MDNEEFILKIEEICKNKSTTEFLGILELLKIRTKIRYDRYITDDMLHQIAKDDES